MRPALPPSLITVRHSGLVRSSGAGICPSGPSTLPAPLRIAAARTDKGLGPQRTLLRSIGMGGTASTLIWNIGYDP
eukprot:4409431-Lingulodinium_polyedra.AAC.1